MDHVLHAAIALIAITNPVGNAPIFLAITEGRSVSQRATDAFRACALAAVLIIGAAAVGSYVLALFGITMPALRIAGGALIVLIGFNMVMSGANAAHESKKGPPDVEGQVYIPFAMPLVAGPGTLATAMTLVADSSTGGSRLASLLVVVAATGLTLGVLWLALMILAPIEQRLGERTTAIVTRLMGLLLLAMGVQFIIDGVTAVWHAASSAA